MPNGIINLPIQFHNFAKHKTNPQKIVIDVYIFGQSCEISPNLVTLVM